LTYQDALHLEYTIYLLHFFVNNAKTLGSSTYAKLDNF